MLTRTLLLITGLLVFGACSRYYGPGSLGMSQSPAPVPYHVSDGDMRDQVHLEAAFANGAVYNADDANESILLRGHVFLPFEPIHFGRNSPVRQNRRSYLILGLSVQLGRYDIRNDSFPSLRGQQNYTAFGFRIGMGNFVQDGKLKSGYSTLVEFGVETGPFAQTVRRFDDVELNLFFSGSTPSTGLPPLSEFSNVPVMSYQISPYWQYLVSDRLRLGWGGQFGFTYEGLRLHGTAGLQLSLTSHPVCLRGNFTFLTRNRPPRIGNLSFPARSGVFDLGVSVALHTGE